MALIPMRREQDQQRQKRHRKGMYILPSLFTMANIGAGYYAILQSIQGTVNDPWHFDFAAKAIGFAILFDGLDGRIARMTHSTSDFGRELDSLADVITFGVAPAILAFLWGCRFLPPTLNHDLRHHIIEIGAMVSFLFLIAGASRLARFNIQVNPQPSNPGRPGRKYFVGMPIPAGAGILAAVVHVSLGTPIYWWWQSVTWILFVAATGFLMVSTWRFYSFKDIDLRSRHPARLVIVIALVLAAAWFFSQYVLLVLALVYMLSGVLARLAYIFRRGSPPEPPPTYKEAPELR